MISKILEIIHPPYDLQNFVEDFPKEFSQNPPGCLPVASKVVRVDSKSLTSKLWFSRGFISEIVV